MKRKIDVFVAGNSKSGTSALCAYLDEHPDVVLSEPKEPNYFATDLCHRHADGAFRQRTEAEYDACFADGGSILVDGSACYLYSSEAAAAIARHNPEARIIAVFREPVDFLYSYHLQMLRNPVSEGEVIADFEGALAAERDRQRGVRLPAGCRVPQLLYYRERVRYAEHLQRFLDCFPDSHIRVYLYDDFRRDNLAVMGDVYDFLGLQPPAGLETAEVNQAVRVKAPRTFRLVQDLAHGRGHFAPIQRLAKAVVPSRIRRAAVKSAVGVLGTADKEPIPESVRSGLRREFRDEVVAFGRLIDRDVATEWGY